jgi:signal transduction histidine kinase
LVIFFILYRNQQNKRKSALLLIDKNEELNNQRISRLIKKHQLDSVKGRLQAEENERHRIAQELHDGIGGSLAAIKLYIDSLRKSSGIKELDLAYDNINTTYEQVRSLSHNLTPPEFKFSSINDIVKDYINQISQHSKTEIVLNSKVSADWSNLDESIQIGIFRITQELMNNVIKHAKANRVVFDLNLDDKNVIIIVKDNGVGFDTSKKMTGIGIRNIKQRVEDLNGSIEINSEPGNGTEVKLHIPI